MTNSYNPHQLPPSKPNPWAWLAIGCGVLVCGVAAFIVILFLSVFGSLRSSTPYKDTIVRVRTNPQVLEALGSPVEPGFWFAGSIKTQNDSGTAELTIPISGPKGKGSVHVQGTKAGGTWTYSEMKVTVTGGEINLLPATQ